MMQGHTHIHQTVIVTTLSCSPQAGLTKMSLRMVARNEQFLLFPQCFLPFWRSLCLFHQIKDCRLQTLSVWMSLKFVIWERVK